MEDFKENSVTQSNLTLSSFTSSVGLANVSSRPGTVGKKNGAALGTLGGCLGLFLCCNRIMLLIILNQRCNIKETQQQDILTKNRFQKVSLGIIFPHLYWCGSTSQLM